MNYKLRLLALIVKYSWWTLFMPNNKLNLRGMAADMQGDLGSFRKRCV